MKAIGKADLFYTLWDISEVQKVPVNKFEYYEVQTLTYLQNLSIDENTAVEKSISLGCKNTEIYESLRGKSSSFQTKTKVGNYPIDIFPYGVLIGSNILESNDVWQLERLSYDSKYEQSETAKSRLIELGEYCIFEDEFISVASKDRMIESREKANYLALITNEALKNGYVDILFEKNLYITENGYATYNIERILTIRFSKQFFTENFYNGFTYGLLKNQKTNKGIRIKNKTYRIFIDENMFCTSFEAI